MGFRPVRQSLCAGMRVSGLELRASVVGANAERVCWKSKGVVQSSDEFPFQSNALSNSQMYTG